MTGDEARREIVEASHILAKHEILDAFGHVSRRSPERSDRFLISRSLAPALVKDRDVLELTLDGDPASPTSERVFLERFIHGAIYRQRPDVHAIVHSHALSVIPFTVSPRTPLRPVYHMCGFLHGTPPPFEVADHAGPSSDLLIRDARLGNALATHLGDAAVVLMRGHGFTTVGSDVPQVTYRAIYAAKNCEVQMAALRLGDPTYLSAGEARTCDEVTNGQVGRPWELWRRELTPFSVNGEGER